MLGRVLKAAAYVKAPRKTFLLLHPFKAVKWLGIAALVSWILRPRGERRERPRTGNRSG